MGLGVVEFLLGPLVLVDIVTKGNLLVYVISEQIYSGLVVLILNRNDYNNEDLLL